MGIQEETSFDDLFDELRSALAGLRPRPAESADDLEEAVFVADFARREGLVALQDVQVENRFLAYGLDLVLAGHEPGDLRLLVLAARGTNEDAAAVRARRIAVEAVQCIANGRSGVQTRAALTAALA